MTTAARPKAAAARPSTVDPQGDQVLREPARIVGRSGRVYGMLGKDGKPEILSIRPANAAAKPKREAGVQVYDTGGEVRSATFDEWGRPLYDPVTDTNYGYSGPPLGAPAATGPVAAPATTSAPAPAPTGTYGAAGTQQYQAQQQVFSSTQTAIDAQKSAAVVQQEQLAASRSSVAAAAAAQEASKTALGASSTYTTAQEKANAEALAAEKAIQAASLNFADKNAVAAVAAARQNEDTLYRVAGYEPPVEVETPTGAGGFVALPGGGVARAQAKTQETMLTEAEKRAGALRILELTKQKLAAERAGDVAAAARIDAQLEGLKADAAGLNVQAAKLGVDAANLGVRQDELNLSISKQPPFAGAVMDQYSGEWITRAELDKREAARSVTQETYDAVNKEYVTAQQLRDRTDAAGNIVRLSDGVLVDSKNLNNEFRDGVWTDVKTGNRLIGDIWTAPDGNMLIGDLWHPGGNYRKVGDVFYDDSNGYFYRGNGVWEHPVSGDQRRWDGQRWIDIPRNTGSGGSIRFNPETGQWEVVP